MQPPPNQPVKPPEPSPETREERLRQAIAAAGLGTWHWDVAQQTLHVSNQSLALLSRPPDTTLTYRQFLDAVHPDDRARLDQAARRALAEHLVFDVEFRSLWPDGSEHWLAAKGCAFYSAAGAPEHMKGVIQDIAARKQAETELRAQAQRYRLLIENSQEAIYVVQQGLLKFVNRKCIEMTGLSEAELLRRSIADFVPAEDRNEVLAYHERVCANLAIAHSREQRFQPSGGQTRWMHVNAVRIEWDGRPASLSFASDITDRKRAEVALREREQQLQLFVEHSPAAIAMLDRDMRYLVVSRRWLTDYHLPEQNLQGRSHYDVFPDIPARWRQVLQRCLAGAIEHSDADPFPRADGTTDWVRWEIRPWRNADGVIGGLLIFSEVITERIRTQAALQQSEERFRDVVFSTADWVWELDTSGHYTFASESSEELLGYRPEEILGRTPFDFMPPAEAQRVGALFREITARRESFSALENVNRHKDGHEVVLETSGMPVFGPDGAFRGYRGMDRDITGRKQLEAELRQAQKLEAIGQLAGGVAHDFNNLLAAILMQMELLLMNPSLDEEAKQSLKEVGAETRRAASVTRQLLMFSRRSVLAVKPLDLNEVVSNLLKLLKRLIGEHIDLRFDAQNPVPPVEADAGMLDQVLMNLVVNARDAMPKGGRITLSTTLKEVTAADTAAHLNRRPGRFVCLSVADNGSGMEPETLKRIFEPFFTTKEAGRGTGLGLATVHGIIAQHRGWLEVESQLGLGSTFRILLPAAATPTVEAALAEDKLPILRGTETILVVEDELKVRRMIVQSLRVLGYAVLEASNGKEAVALWQAHGARVDLLFTDMVMPEGMTGLELAEQLKGLKPRLKAIISSGYTGETVSGATLAKAGAVYLPKPYDIKVLAQTIRTVLDQKGHSRRRA